ncbi:hypothetical protein [uncultured Thiodictyon sp.]|jgi:hypothetical protein|uniref:hypothetical protein n=1 Tax=uncultured Thiodictyon sp. TaxID=1846217 RepID=UPI0025D5C1AD|nr:hypothetical protein [uncultured Thiodictyon sp.]
MQPIRRIVDDAPDSVSIPEELRHRRIELIIWPLDEEPQKTLPTRPRFNIAQVDHIDIPSREERNARR